MKKLSVLFAIGNKSLGALFVMCIFVGGFFTSGAREVQAQPIILEAEADTLIRTDLNVRRNDNHGCERILSVGTSRGGGSISFGGPDAMRSLIRFDLSAISITSIAHATLELTVFGYDNGSPSSVYTVDVHRIVDSGPLTPWIEGDGQEAFPFHPGCTGVDPAGGVAWMGGADPFNSQGATLGLNNQTQPNFDPTVIASATIDQGVNMAGDVIQWDITPLVQDWLDGTVPNHGIMLIDVTSNGLFRGVRFGAREGRIFECCPDVVDGPRLNIDGIMTSIPGDVDGDGDVDQDDLDIVVSCFGQTAPLVPPCDAADVAPPPDGDGVINILDISFVGSNFTP